MVAVVAATSADAQIFRKRVQKRLEEKREEQKQAAADAHVTVHGPAACGAGLNLGYHVQTFSSGLRAAVWYPTKAAESRFEYGTGPYASAIAVDAPVADCERYPLIVYSHGFGGCGTIALFLTEALARAGYIVAAPDHKDAKCKIDEVFSGSFVQRAEEPFRKPDKWTPETYKDRADDLRLILDELPRDPRFGEHIDRNRIGASGHSLGGYTVMGLAGGWSSWRDDRIKAALLMSPYVRPFATKGTIRDVHIPLMYQGGTRDFGITPYIKKAGGAYDTSNPPKFFEEIDSANHLDWSNRVCRTHGSIPECNAQTPMARAITEYGIAFFDRFLKGKNEPILDRSSPELADYRHTDR